MSDRHEQWALDPEYYEKMFGACSEVIEDASCPDCGGVLVRVGDNVQCEHYGRECDYISGSGGPIKA